MRNVILLRTAAVLVCLVFAGGWAAGCGAAKAPATTPEPPKYPGAVPPGRTTAPPATPPGRVAQPAPAVQGDAGAAVAAVAVAGAVAATAPAAPARPPAPDPLVGHVTRGALENYETWKTLRAEDYTPDAAAVKKIAQRGKDVQVLAIVATWCPDSRREVPRFFKIYDQAGLGMGTVTMVAVDRSKKDAEGLTVKYEILRVPTFVFLRGDREIGRVVERADTTLENDIAAILAK